MFARPNLGMNDHLGLIEALVPPLLKLQKKDQTFLLTWDEWTYGPKIIGENSAPLTIFNVPDFFKVLEINFLSFRGYPNNCDKF